MTGGQAAEPPALVSLPCVSGAGARWTDSMLQCSMAVLGAATLRWPVPPAWVGWLRVHSRSGRGRSRSPSPPPSFLASLINLAGPSGPALFSVLGSQLGWADIKVSVGTAGVRQPYR